LESSTGPSREEELKSQILQSLKRRADVDNLTFDLCKQTGWVWKKSSDFIASIRRDHGSEIEFLWAKVFSILGIACVAIGVLILFYFFDIYVGWNNVASCLQKSFQSQAAAASNNLTGSDCLSMTFLGVLGTFSNNYGYIAITLIVGGFAGFIIAQRQMKSTFTDPT
jgi:hypothetical protein